MKGDKEKWEMMLTVCRLFGKSKNALRLAEGWYGEGHYAIKNYFILEYCGDRAIDAIESNKDIEDYIR